MREFINKTMITGVLVKSTLEEKTTDKGEYIGGELIIRTADDNEHEVKIFYTSIRKILMVILQMKYLNYTQLIKL